MDTLELEEKISIESDMLASFKSEVDEIDSKRRELDEKHSKLNQTKITHRKFKSMVRENRILMVLIAVVSVIGLGCTVSFVANSSLIPGLFFGIGSAGMGSMIPIIKKDNKEYISALKFYQEEKLRLTKEVNDLQDKMVDESLRQSTLYKLIKDLENKISTNKEELNKIKYYNNEFETVVEDNILKEGGR